jgi:hypothetical protein
LAQLLVFRLSGIGAETVAVISAGHSSGLVLTNKQAKEMNHANSCLCHPEANLTPIADPGGYIAAVHPDAP